MALLRFVDSRSSNDDARRWLFGKPRKKSLRRASVLKGYLEEGLAPHPDASSLLEENSSKNTPGGRTLSKTGRALIIGRLT